MRESLKGLEFKNFDDIQDFDIKLTKFLNSLDEELKHWRDYVEIDGNRSISHPMAGYACLDKDKIVAISYYTVVKKFSIKWFLDLLFTPKGLESGVVVKKEYQRRGISRHLADIKKDVLRKLDYKHFWFKTDSDNIALLKWHEKYGRSKIIKRTKKTIYFGRSLDENESRQKES